MKVGDSVSTLPTVKPKLYAGKVGTIAVRNEDEFGVLINGKIVWFVEKEIEICQSTKPTLSSTGRAPGSSSDRVPADGEGHRAVPTNGPAVTRGSMSAGTTTHGTMRDALPVERRSVAPRVPLTNPSSPVPGSERPSEPRPPSAASRGSGDLSGFNPGERGPGGGVVAKCAACGGTWERPKQRGRPSLKCEGCRG